MGNKAAVNQLDDQNGSKAVAKTVTGTPEISEVPVNVGGPSRTRTLDPLIKRPDLDITRDQTDALNDQQLDLWSDA